MSPRIGQALVTGAAGFVGSRLLHRLVEADVPARALVRRRLPPADATAGADWRYADVTQPATLADCFRGCDVVFHCAWGDGPIAQARAVNVEGTRHVIEAAAQQGVRRVVHLSTMAVHGDVDTPELDESAPLIARGDAYGVSKAEGEQLALDLGRMLGIEVVVLRPTLVYGPGAPYWLVGYFERVKQESVALVDGGRGLVNLLFVDDLVDAMLAAATATNAPGSASLVSGETPITWADYLGHFARMCRKPMPPSVPAWRARLEVQALRVYGAFTRRPRRLLGMDLRLMTQRTAVCIERARALLDWTPTTSVEEGMAICADWLRREGRLPRPSRPRPAAATPLRQVAVQ